MSERVRVDRRVYLTEDREQAVPEGHPDARFLLCTPGSEMLRADAVRYGLLDAPAPDPEPAEPEAEAKQSAPPDNKARRAAPNKGA